jgi:uncharacterized protein
VHSYLSGVIRDERVVIDVAKRSPQDRSIHGYKAIVREDPERARLLADRIVKNTYRTLMTRGQMGCYLFCVDAETNAYFQRFVAERARVEAVHYQKVAETAGDYATKPVDH